MFTSKQTCFNKQCSEKYIYTLQEKLDIDSEESDLHALNIIWDTDKDNDDFCVDFMDEEDNWRDVFLLSEREC
jgi:hypothetical protein